MTMLTIDQWESLAETARQSRCAARGEARDRLLMIAGDEGLRVPAWRSEAGRALADKFLADACAHLADPADVRLLKGPWNAVFQP